MISSVRRLSHIRIIGRITTMAEPKDASKIYDELCDNKDFSVGTVFDWTNVK